MSARREYCLPDNNDDGKAVGSQQAEEKIVMILS